MVKERDKSKNGRGGLTTKIKAFRRCSQTGILGVLINSEYITNPNINITDLITEKELDKTVFYGKK